MIDSIETSAPTVAPGGFLSVTVRGHDPDCATGACSAGCGAYIRADLTLWSAPAGSLGTPNNGTSASPYTSTVDWQAPAAEGTYSISVTLSDSGTLLCGGRNSVSGTVDVLVTTSTNRPPVVSTLTAAPTQLLPGQTATLSCAASDPDGDPITYAWSTDTGTVTATGASASFAGTQPGIATVTCTATDPEGAAGSGTVRVSVTDALAESRLARDLGTPQRIAVDSMGDVYVADPGRGGLAAFNLADGELVYRIPFVGVTSVAVDWQDRLLVGGGRGAWLLDRSGLTLLALDPGEPLGAVMDVAVDRARRRYAVLYGDTGRILVHDETGARIGAVGVAGDGPSELRRPQGVAFTPEGDLVVADGAQAMIKVIGLDGTLRLSFGGNGTSAGRFVRLDDVEVGADGVIYASDAYQAWVQAFNPDGTLRETIGTYGVGLGQFRTPAGIAAAADHRKLIVASLNTPSLEVFRMRGDPVSARKPQPALSTTAIGFPATAVGAASPAGVVTLSNVGTAPLGIRRVVVNGEFRQASDCGPALDPGSTCSFNLTYVPETPGTATGSLDLETSANPGRLAVALTGQAFLASTVSLSVSRRGIGRGSIISSPSGIDCGPDCTEDFASGARVTLTAVPGPGSALVGWGGACAGVSLDCPLTMDSAKAADASFDLVGERVTWERFIKTEAVGTTLRRPAGAGWDAGAVSTKVLVSGDGYAEYQVTASTGQLMFGLSHGDTDGSYSDIDYAIHTYPRMKQLIVWEKGVYRGKVGTYAVDDRLRVSVEGGFVTYRRNGELLYTSGEPPTYPLLVDTSVYSSGGEVFDGLLAGALDVRTTTGSRDVFWRNAVRVTTEGSTLRRESGVGWTAGASSAQELVSGDGYAEYRVSDPGSYIMFGLSNGDSDRGWGDIDYAISTSPSTGQLMVFEQGSYQATLGSYQVGNRLRVAVEGGAVVYSVDDVVLYTSSTPPTYPLLADTSLYSSGAVLADARMGGELREVVSWTHLTGVEVQGDALVRPGAGGWTAGAISSRRIAAGNGGAEYPVADMASHVMFGLSHGNTDGGYIDIDYAIGTDPATGQVAVFENGVQRGQFGAYAVGDRLKVSVGDGVVSYWKNGGLLYTSPTAPTYPLILDVSLYAGRIEGARLTGDLSSVPLVGERVVWTNLANVTDSEGTLQRPTGAGWDAGAVSTQTLTGDGYVEYRVSSLSDAVVFGLGTGDTDQGFEDIEHGIYTDPGTGSLHIYEGGVYRTGGSGYAVGDTLRVAVEGGIVKYRKNGVLVYSSTVPPTYPLNADASLYSTGATIFDATIGVPAWRGRSGR